MTVKNGNPLQRAAGSAVVRVVVIGVLVFVLQIPLLLVQDMIRERGARYHQTVQEIGGQWGRAQLLMGPVLVLPYKTRSLSANGFPTETNGQVYLLPETLDIGAKVTPERRYRGIFETVVYGLDFTLKSHFATPKPPEVTNRVYQWDQAYLVMDVTDPRNLVPAGGVRVGGAELPVRPAAQGQTLLNLPGVQAALPGLSAESKGFDVAFTATLRGSADLSFIPAAEKTTASLQSSWPAPGFTGAYSPATRKIGADGFTATWDIGFFGRGYGQTWESRETAALQHPFRASAFGVELVQPANDYQQVDRATKYGNLFIVLTFAAYFLFELLAGARVHLMQYGLLGASLVMFYVLLLSLSEPLGFAPAYALSAIAVLVQSTLYGASVLRRKASAALVGALLLGLYMLLYVILGMESYALLSGAIVLFAVLSAIMYLTRNVDWGKLTPKLPTPPAAPSPAPNDG
ncbi:MAG: cell envelope integrity protein CreD [Magnetospiraceae bacterium]